MTSSNMIKAAFVASFALANSGPQSTPAFASAFQAQPTPLSSTISARSHETALAAAKGNDGEESSFVSRRSFVQGAGIAMTALLGETILGQPAEASYSAYTRREEDWKTREKNGEIQYSNARQLRDQLREIAPMNNADSKIFCPNGPSAAVSPLMENKCGDRMALPSVYGRTEDTLGNSIPGFGAANAATLRAELEAQAYFRN